MIYIAREKNIVTVQIFYVIPGYQLIINEFLWQTLDLRPRYPRVHRFLDYWHREIDAVIKDIIICDAAGPTATTLVNPTIYHV
jgi:uncharacterized protein Usg